MPPRRCATHTVFHLGIAALYAAGTAAQPAPEPEPLGPTITDVTFESGSPLGSQRIALTGTGFTTNFHSGGNQVEIGSSATGWSACEVVEGACTVDCGSASRIVCDTDQVPSDWYTGDIADVSSGPLDFKVTVCYDLCGSTAPETQDITAGPFEFTPARHSHQNPTLLGVSPRHISANSGISLTGSRFGNTIKDYRVVYVGSGRPPIGGNVDVNPDMAMRAGRDGGTSNVHAMCRPQSLNRAAPEDEEGERRQPVMAEDFEPLPITPDFYRCELGDFEAGSYNVSVQLPRGLAWANPVDVGLFSVDGYGIKYQVQYYPTIDSIEANGVSPASGSLAGGTEVVIRGHGFSMDDHDIAVEMGGSKCRVMRSTLEEIICVTDPVVPTPVYTTTTGVGAADCATVVDPPTLQGECATCNAGGELSGGLCRETPTVTITVEDSDPGASVHGMVSSSSGGGNTFVTDEGAAKGDAWAIFSAPVALSGTYELQLAVPAAAYCSPRATAVPVVVHHSGTARRTVVSVDLTAPGPVVLGSFFFEGAISRPFVNTFQHVSAAFGLTSGRVCCHSAHGCTRRCRQQGDHRLCRRGRSLACPGQRPAPSCRLHEHRSDQLRTRGDDR